MKRYTALLTCLFVLTACGNQSSDAAANDAQAADSGDSSAMADEAQSSDQSSDQNAGDSSSEAAAGSGDFADESAKRSYALGMDIGSSLKELPVDIDMDSLTQGVRDVVSGGKTKLTQDQLNGVMQSFVQDMEATQKKKAQEQAQTNESKGEKFLADNKTKDGVKTTDSGLQYKVMQEGDGPSPDSDDSVTVHYTGKLIDGTVFDSSRQRGEPVTFSVDAVIPGWTEALQLMKQGAKYELYVPAKLAYGERGAGAQIGPNETLIFDVELLNVDQKDADSAKAAGSAGNSSSSTDSQGDSSDDGSQSSTQSPDGSSQNSTQGSGSSSGSSQNSTQGSGSSSGSSQDSMQGSGSSSQDSTQGSGSSGDSQDSMQGSGNSQNAMQGSGDSNDGSQDSTQGSNGSEKQQQ